MFRSNRSVIPVALATLALALVLSVDASAEGITGGEAARLRHQHQQYQQMKRLANVDGEVTRREQARLNHKAAQLRRLIHTAKNN